MGRKCGVEGCLSDSNRPEDVGVTFHKVPGHTDIRPKWMQLCRIPEDKKNIKIIYVCSRHFLRADFCNFKGKKYMLRQGVLPSVFPWDKSKLDSIKTEIKKEAVEQSPILNDSDPASDLEKIKTELTIKEEISDEVDFKLEPSESVTDDNTPEQKTTQKSLETDFGTINFAINSKIEVVDFNRDWHPARIAEIDYEENEVLIHFEDDATRIDEWICMDSPRLRPFQVRETLTAPHVTVPEGGAKKGGKVCETFVIGERCLACWSDARKFPATVTKVLPNDFYEVLFDDGFVKNLKAHRMGKSEGKSMQSSPLFDPVQGTKQDRRDKKRKINVAALFGKRQKLEEEKSNEASPPLPPVPQPHPPRNPPRKKPSKPVQTNEPDEKTEPIQDSSVNEVEQWLPKWLPNGLPDGIKSQIETHSGKRKSWVVSDPRLPPNWTKHMTQRISGASAGKWDMIIVSPEKKPFRTRTEIKNYIDAFPHLNLNEAMFDFSIYRRSGKSLRSRKRKRAPVTKKVETTSEASVVEENNVPQTPIKEEVTSEDAITPPPNHLKILVIDDAYKCPIEGCGKNFRKENLAQMHVKHYHPEYAKFLDSTPNVSDLAYARTVGDSLDRSPGPVRTTPKSKQPLTTPKIATITTTKPPLIEALDKQATTDESTLQAPIKPKDSEIIKLLNSKPYSEQTVPELDTTHPIPAGLPSNMYPDIKLKDLLTSEGIPKMDDHVLKTLSTTRPTGIKTLLPVRGTSETDPLQVLSTTRPSGIKTILPVSHVGDVDLKQQLSITRSGIKTLLPVRPAETEHKQEGEVRHNYNNKQRSHTLKVHTKQGIRRKRGLTEPFDYRPEKTSPNQDPFSDNSAAQEAPLAVEHPTHILEGGQLIKIVRMKQEEIINCTCGYAEEDGLMIQCELCLCWQHAYCNNIERESQVPDKYVCYICQNPLKQRPSRKYYHDQDWLKLGVLPTTSFHSKDDETLQKRFETLKKSHDVSGALLELKDFMHTLRVKIKIAEEKNHPKLYLWSKPWEKQPLPEKMDETKDKCTGQEGDKNNESMLMMILKNDKEDNKLDLNAFIDNNQVQAPIIPQPEAAIDSAVCRINLLEHISHSQGLVDERLDDLEKIVGTLEEGFDQIEEKSEYPRTRETVQMLLRDLNTLQEFSQLSSL